MKRTLRTKLTVKTETPAINMDLEFNKGSSLIGVVKELVNWCDGVKLVKAPEWINLEKTGKLPDDNDPCTDFDDVREVIAHWSNGDVEVSRYFYTAMDTPVFQRMDGTNENQEGWNGNAGEVLDWMFKPELPKAPKA